MKTQSLVIGNGESRRSIILNSDQFLTYGCNAAYRDFKVDKLFCYDKRMVIEFLTSDHDLSTIIYTKKEHVNALSCMYSYNLIRSFPDLPYIGINRPDQPKHWNSGQYALLNAAYDDNEEIFLIGFDLYSKNSKVNNIYKDTANYSSSDSHCIDPSYWIYQNSKIFELFPHKKFYIVNELEWAFPDEWRFPNTEFLSLDNFKFVLHYK